MPIGPINQSAVYPYEVVNAAFEQQARSMTLVHNHTSGEPRPSCADIAVTRDVEKALMVKGVTLHEHLMIADTKCVSLKSLGNLQRRYALTRPQFFFIFLDISRVISPALRLAANKPGPAAFKALPTASPAFFCTAGLRAAVISAVIKKRRNSILCVPGQIDHKC